MPTILGANSDTGAYEISNSLVLYGGDSKLTQTPGSDGDRQKWTWNGWVKRTGVEDDGMLFSVGTYTRIQFSSDTLYVQVSNNDSTAHAIQTDRKFRDPAAWYMITVAVDTTQGTAANRLKLYINGVQETSFSVDQRSAITQNASLATTGQFEHRIGVRINDIYYNDSYIAEVNLIDGLQLTPSSFGETNDNGVWIPKKYIGAYGTNGFFLEFKQTGTSANSSGIGADTSGNDHHFTVANINAHSVNVDTPTLNYCTLNPVGATDNQGSSGTLDNGALRISVNQKSQGLTMDNSMLDGGRWYFEVYLAGGSLNTTIGFRNSDNGDDTPSVEIESDGQIKKDGSNQGSTDTAFSNGMVVGVILDWSNTSSRKITFETNNSAHSEGQQTFSDSSSNNGFHYHGRESGGTQLYNFGNTPAVFGNKTAGDNADANGYGNFFYAVPSNHYAINSKNLAEYG